MMSPQPTPASEFRSPLSLNNTLIRDTPDFPTFKSITSPVADLTVTEDDHVGRQSESYADEETESYMDDVRATVVGRPQSIMVASTPAILTPQQNGALVLLSPSRTITESLTALASTTAQQLEEVWDAIGYSSEDRASQLSDLLVKFRDACETKIAEENKVANTFRQTITDARQEIVATATALKVSLSDRLLGEQSVDMTLTDELAALENALEGLRNKAEEAKHELRECRDFIIESHEMLGLTVNPKWLDISTDLTDECIAAFQQKVEDMKSELSSRTSAIIQLVRDCQSLQQDLRLEEEEAMTDADRRIADSLVLGKDGSYMMTSKVRSDSCTGINSEAMDELTTRVAELHREKKRRKMKLQEMGAEIALLWEKLRVPEADQLSFTESVQGLGVDTIEKGEAELHRLHSMKTEMLSTLVTEARKQILELWNATNADMEQRKAVDFYYVDQISDDLLDKHEEHIRILEERLEQMKPIIDVIQRREAILEERMEYEELQKDSDRLKQRGAAMTRQLMKEEKMAKHIRRDLPHLTELLTEMLQDWQVKHGEAFRYSGRNYFDVMEKQDEEWNQYKEEEMQRRLKRKQEENIYADSRFASSKASGSHRLAAKTKGASTLAKPFADTQNTRHQSRGRFRQPGC